ncbi:MAG: hypothetical protein HY402_02395 [Elusimicrobia bacterium]|nr:hypothetical protein [Elusimicrobiota bacterium]
MQRKVKNFKLEIREKEVLRRLKKCGDGSLSLEAVREAVERASQNPSPAALYRSFQNPETAKESLPPCAQSLPGLAVSVGAVALQGSWPRDTLWQTIQEVALEEALRFALGLLESEAAQEQCALGPPVILTAPEDRLALFKILELEKIGVALSKDGEWEPSACSAFLVGWLKKE